MTYHCQSKQKRVWTRNALLGLVFYLLKYIHTQCSATIPSCQGDKIQDPKERCVSKLFSAYFGNDMSSLMFQEIREYRSYAYQVNGLYRLPSFLTKEEPGYFQMRFSTQSDKTTDAIGVLEDLINNMPLHPERMEMIKQNIRNRVNNTFPSFRNLSVRDQTVP